MKSGSRKKFIGVFDSGFGGLHILKGIIKELPEYNYIYLGDTARNPYGNRSEDIIYKFTKQAVNFLFKNDCEIIILACNTVSCDALRRIQREYLPKKYPNKKVIGVLIPASEEAIEKTKNNRVGFIATEGTVLSGAFEKELIKLQPKSKIFKKACPLLVPIIEAGEQNSKATELVLEKYLSYFRNKNIDTLILGCTHYGILEGKIKKIVGSEIKLISEAKIVPKKLKNYLERHKEIEMVLGKNKIVNFYSTDLTDNFKNLGGKFFGNNIKVRKAELE
ncbi:MAG: glutamate racemase [Parcubacteria group bacterium]|jgi:glutamate racemase